MFPTVTLATTTLVVKNFIAKQNSRSSKVTFLDNNRINDNTSFSLGSIRMTAITTDKDLITLINVFTVELKNQQRLVDILVEAGEATSKQPGFISAKIHRSLDGMRVINYVQWRCKEDLEAISNNPEMKAHIDEIKKLAKGNTSLYEVCAICEAS